MEEKGEVRMETQFRFCLFLALPIACGIPGPGMELKPMPDP